MDPLATLNQVASYIDDGQYEDAEDCLENYRDWRENGGFEPIGGDQRADELQKTITGYFTDVDPAFDDDYDEEADEDDCDDEYWEYTCEKCGQECAFDEVLCDDCQFDDEQEEDEED